MTWHILVDFHGKRLPITKHPTGIVVLRNDQGLSFTSPLPERISAAKYGKGTAAIPSQSGPQSDRYNGQTSDWKQTGKVTLSNQLLLAFLRLKALYLYKFRGKQTNKSQTKNPKTKKQKK